MATFQFLHLLERLGKLWQILAIISVDSLAVSGSVLQSVTVHSSSVVVRAVCVSLLQSLAVCGNYDNLWQSMAVSGSQLAVIANPYQPERRRREGQLRTSHDPMLAFSRIFSIPINSQTP